MTLQAGRWSKLQFRCIAPLPGGYAQSNNGHTQSRSGSSVKGNGYDRSSGAHYAAGAMTDTTTEERHLYQQVAARIRADIDGGRYQPGSRLPGQRDLCGIYGCSRQAIRQALDMLAREQRITAGVGRGTFVRIPAARFTPTEPVPVGALRARLESAGQVSRQRLEVATRTPPEAVRVRLDLSPDALVVARRRVLYVDDDPLFLGTYWFPDDLVAGTRIAGNDDVPEGTTRLLADMGHPLVGWTAEVTARNPEGGEAELLEVPRGTPVLVQTWTHHDPSGRPVRVYEQVLPADRHILVFTGEQDPGQDVP